MRESKFTKPDGAQYMLVKAQIDTPLGPMMALGDASFLYFLGFVTEEIIAPWGSSKITDSIQGELHHYFEGKLRTFKTPLAFRGTFFQRQVWAKLQQIPFGVTKSYLELAVAIGNPTAFRAVAQANRANQHAIVVPCHRVINTNGRLGGYNSGPMYKKWLLNHEECFLKNQNFTISTKKR